MPAASAPRSSRAPSQRGCRRRASWSAMSARCGARCALLARPWPVVRLDDARAGAPCPPRCLPVWQPPGLPAGLAELPMGRVRRRRRRARRRLHRGGRATGAAAGAAAAIVTAPIHKEALAAAGVAVPGPHRDAAGAGARRRRAAEVRMMLANDELRVVLVTIHVSLRRAIDALDFDARAATTLRIAHDAGRRCGPRGAAHRGGRPEPARRRRRPVRRRGTARHRAGDRRRARAEGIDASGPFAPDTVFMRARHAPGHAASSTSWWR